MNRFNSLWLLLLIIALPVDSADWEMAFPVKENGVITNELLVITDGQSVKSAFTKSLLNNFASRFSNEFREWLGSQPPLIANEELVKKGLTITLNFKDLEIDFQPDVSILSQQSISARDKAIESSYSKSTFWSWQNNFTATSEYESELNEYSAGLEINSGFNIGGYRGVNGIVRGYIDYSEEKTTFTRGISYLFVEHPEEPYRYSLGDVDTFSKGHLSVIPIGGFKLERDYTELQPERQIRNNGTQYLELVESAVVDVYINGFRSQTLRLNPGRYDLDNIPLIDGDNEIRLEILYASGGTETITYSQFYNASLLLEGLADYGFSAGSVSTSEDDGINYTDDIVLTGFYEYGVMDMLTLGINGLYHEDSYQIGITALQGTPIGNFGLRLSKVDYAETLNTLNESVSQGYNVGLDFTTSVWGSSENYGSNLRMSFEVTEDFTSTTWDPSYLTTQYGGRIDYSWSITPYLDINYYSSHFWVSDSNSEDRYDSTYNLRADWRGNNWRFTLGGEYIDNLSYDEDLRGYINIDYYFNLPADRKRFNVTYSSKLEKLRAEYSKTSNDIVGDYGYTLAASSVEDKKQIDGSVDYVANRWRGDLYLSGMDDEQEINFNGKATLSTSFIVADGVTGWGRSPVGPSAIINVHPTLEGSNIHLNENYYGDVESISTAGNNSVVALSRGHQDNLVTYTSPDAPMGYDLGTGIGIYKPGAMTVHVLNVGSDASRTVIGNLQNADKTPVSYLRGIVVDSEGNEKPIFTNKSGRFALEGLSLRSYIIFIDGYTASFSLSEESAMLIYLPTLTLQRGL
ncbi:hypothetical protein [Vibrio alfacsensis]|uniref:hypothetical protein n=1 Tax=Vibrio alfacsensis TaxID=1074311 RepID=UPI00406981B1